MEPQLVHDVFQAVAAVAAAVSAIAAIIIRKHQRADIRERRISRKFRKY